MEGLVDLVSLAIVGTTHEVVTCQPYIRNNTNTNINTLDDIYSAIIYGASHMREFTLGPLDESRSAPGGRQLIGQAAN